MQLKILLLTQYFPPESGAGASRAYEHARYWKNIGVDVTVLTCMPHYPTGKIPVKYKGKFIYKEKIDDIDVIRTFTYAAASKGFFKRFFAYFTFMVSSVIQGLSFLKDKDYIIATSPPFSIGISGWIMSLIKKTPLIFEVRDLWPASLIQLGQIKNRFLIRSLVFIEKKIYNHSLYIISVTDSYCDLIIKKGVERNKIKVVKNGVDIEFFKKIKRDENLLKLYHLGDKKVVSYFGNFGLSQPIDQIVKIANYIKENNYVHFLLIGDGEKKDYIIELIDNYNLQNITVLPIVDKKKLLRYYSISDIMLVPLQNISLFKTVIPSKIFEIMAVEKTILHNVDGETKKIVEDANAGLYVDFFNTKKSSETIICMLNNEILLKEYSQNGRNYVEKYHDRKSIAEAYIKFLQRT